MGKRPSPRNQGAPASNFFHPLRAMFPSHRTWSSSGRATQLISVPPVGKARKVGKVGAAGRPARPGAGLPVTSVLRPADILAVPRSAGPRGMTPRPFRRSQRPRLAWLPLLLTAGCQVPAAHVAGCGPDEEASCRMTLTRRLAEDSAAEAGCRPLRCGCTLLADPLQFLAGTGRGCVGRRLALPLLSAPRPLAPCAEAPPHGPPAADLRP